MYKCICDVVSVPVLSPQVALLPVSALEELSPDHTKLAYIFTADQLAGARSIILLSFIYKA